MGQVESVGESAARRFHMFSSILIISTASVMAAPAIPVNTVEGLRAAIEEAGPGLSLIHISEPTRPY